MHRQFTSGGMEKEVARWLKEMGYRGPGLKKENLMPLCRGDMRDVWEALIAACRPEAVAQDIKGTVDLKLRRQAALESRQKCEERGGERQRRAKRIEQLKEQAREKDGQLEKMQAHIAQKQNELSTSEMTYSKQREGMQTKVHKSKILTSFVNKAEEATRSIQEEMTHLKKHNADAKRAVAEGHGEDGIQEFEAVMQAMHTFTANALNQKLHTRSKGELLKVDAILPMITSQPSESRPEIKRLVAGIGHLYAHHTARLMEFFVATCNHARYLASQYEAKYFDAAKRLEGAWDGAQVRGVEDMQLAQIKAFLNLKQSLERDRQRTASKRTPAAELFLEKAGNQEAFNCQLDIICLKSEIETLEKEIAKLEAEVPVEGVRLEQEVKELYEQLKDHLEQSHQMDLLIEYFLQQIDQLQKDFDKISMAVTRKLQDALPPMVETCKESLRKCEDTASKELERFCRCDLNGSVKRLSLTETGMQSAGMPLMQRLELAQKSTRKEGDNYWTGSLRELFTEMRQMLPLLKIESPEAIFQNVARAVRCNLFNASLHQHLQHADAFFTSETCQLESESASLIEKEEQYREETDQGIDKIDEILKSGHETSKLLQTDIPQAFEDFRDLPAFKSVPWMKPPPQRKP